MNRFTQSTLQEEEDLEGIEGWQERYYPILNIKKCYQLLLQHTLKEIKHGPVGTRLFIFLTFVSFLACVEQDQIENRGESELHSYNVDSLIFSRLDKPSWIVRKHYPREVIVIRFNEGISLLYQDSLLIKVNDLANEDKERILHLLSKVPEAQLNHIYNANQYWLPEINLQVFTNPLEYTYMIKSFGNEGNTPDKIKALHSGLLRKMRKEFSNAYSTQ